MDYESGLTKPCTRAAILSLQSSEEAVAWLRCIQVNNTIFKHTKFFRKLKCVSVFRQIVIALMLCIF